jgi:PadR family transcriptional regulator, regulatory protein AphA
VALELTPTSHVVLGMIHIGAHTGYAIKRAVDLSARFFWTLSPVQIYPELKRLEEAGYISGQDEPSGGRPRRVFQLTRKGRDALREWLRSEEEPTLEWRDTGLLKLFLADALRPDEALERLRAIRQRSERLAEQFRTEIVPHGEAELARHGFGYPLLTAEFGLAYHEWVARWCSERESELLAAPTASD